MAARGIDHLVLAVRDLDAARGFYEGLGFLTTPVARHPWGTQNSLVQFDGAFLELLTVADPMLIEEPDAGRFSFGAFNRDALARREGMTMLVLDSADEAADRADFLARGLPVFEPFRFERIARRPDGGERTVAFSLTFTASQAMADIGFFTCRQHFPENFWTPAYQAHPNGISGIEAVVIAAEDPAAAAPFLAAFVGTDTMRTVEGGVSVQTARGRIDVLSAAAIARRWGEGLAAADTNAPRLAALVFAGGHGAGARIIPASEAHGVGLVLPA